MPIIGKFTENTDHETGEITYKGGISFGGVDQALMIVPNRDRRGENSPAYRVLEVPSGKFSDPEIGAGFLNTRRSDGSKFIGLQISGTKFPQDLSCAMLPGREAGQHVVIWNRPQPRPAEGGAE